MKNVRAISLLTLAIGMMVGGCSKKEEISSLADQITAVDAQNQSKMDQASNDMQDIVETSLAAQFTGISGRNGNFVDLPSCANVTPSSTPTSWTRTIDFSPGCTLANGSSVGGQIVISGAIPFTQQNYVVTYTLNNFMHNGNTYNGTRTVTRSVMATDLSATPHPVYDMDINMTANFPNVGTYTRVGHRVREFVEGFGDNVLANNVYKINGNWTTTRPDGVSHTTSVTTPITINMGCQYKITQGVIHIVRNNHNADINYGEGTCDNVYTISIDGGAPMNRTF